MHGFLCLAFEIIKSNHAITAIYQNFRLNIVIEQDVQETTGSLMPGVNDLCRQS
jgi:hypothetical protein